MLYKVRLGLQAYPLFAAHTHALFFPAKSSVIATRNDKNNVEISEN